MDSLHIGSDELEYIQTEKVSLTIKEPAAHPSSQGMAYPEIESSCNDDYHLSLKGCDAPSVKTVSGGDWSGIYTTLPLFFEQQRYELIIEAEEGHKVAFWHDNLNIRNKVTQTGRRHNILSGVINFGNEIGLSDLVIQVDDANYLRLVIEVYPSKISYKEDYQAIVEDVTREIYNVIFDILKKTYENYRQGDRISSSPVEFFAVIQKIYGDFIKAADMILAQPHHVLETTHEVLPVHKVRRIDSNTLHWIEKHPEQARLTDSRVSVAKALAVKKQVTYDTKENRLTKYILKSIVKKLRSFKRNYLHLQRQEDKAVIIKIDEMIKGLDRRSNTSFLKEVSGHETSSECLLCSPWLLDIETFTSTISCCLEGYPSVEMYSIFP